jgi:membrane protease YdiL (CAAX protease family)
MIEEQNDSSLSDDPGILPVGAIILATAAFLALEIGSVWLGAHTGIEEQIAAATGSLLTLPMVVTVIELMLITLLLAYGRLAPAGAGLALRSLPVALLVAVSVWGLAQLAQAIVSLGRHSSLSIYVGWAQPAAMIAPFLQRFLTEVFAEEIFWRGILFAWLLSTLTRKAWGDPFTRLGGALLGSQLLYGLSRLPGQIVDPSPMMPPGGELLIFTLTGMFYALVYLRTGNLWIAMAIHALALWPLPLFAFDLDPAKLIILISSLLLIPVAGRSETTPSDGKTKLAEPERNITVV